MSKQEAKELLRFINFKYSAKCYFKIDTFALIVDMWYRSIMDDFLLDNIHYRYDKNIFYLTEEVNHGYNYSYGPSLFVTNIIEKILDNNNLKEILNLTEQILLIKKPVNQEEAYIIFKEVIYKQLI